MDTTEEQKQITEEIARVRQETADEREKSLESSARLSGLSDELVDLYERYITLASPNKSKP
jgi:methyl-accepting chemotaxis protein